MIARVIGDVKGHFGPVTWQYLANDTLRVSIRWKHEGIRQTILRIRLTRKIGDLNISKALYNTLNAI